MDAAWCLSAPLYVELAITERCQSRCLYCSAMPFSEREMDTDTALRIVSELGDLRVFTVVISGGEPTLHPGILEIVDAATRRIPKVMLNTNGILLADYGFASELCRIAPRATLSISLDSADVNVNDVNRRFGAEAVKAIRICAALGQTVCLSNRLTDESISCAEGLMDEFYPSVTHFSVLPRISRTLHESLLNSEEYWKRVEDFGSRLNAKYGTRNELSVVLPFRTMPLEERGDLLNHVQRCCCPFTKMFVDSTGRAFPCFYSAHTDNLLGELHETSVSQVWKSENAQRVRSKALSESPCGMPPGSRAIPLRYRGSAL
ncbi:MAG: radical SAM protein [Holophagales bacterium]|nr:radical SAM protein [Holophagales bacterium]